MKTFPCLALFLLIGFGTSTLSAADLPGEVLVQTDMVAAAKFTPWKVADPAEYTGTFSGDVGGDTTGKLEIKIATTGKEEAPYNVSGTYTHAVASLDPCVVTFTHGGFGDPDSKFITMVAGPVSISFVILDGKKGVIIGGAFIPKS